MAQLQEQKVDHFAEMAAEKKAFQAILTEF